MISITMLFLKHYKQIILLISIIPIIFLIYGMYKFSLKKIIISIAIIIVLLCAFFYLTKREPSSKYAAKTVVHLEEKLKQYDNLLTNYDGLNTKLYDEAKKVEAEIKELTESLNLTKEEKEKVEKKLEENENKIKEIRDKYDNVEKNICILNGQLIDLEKQKEQKEKEIKQKEEQLAKEQDEAVRKQLRDEIKQLQKEQNEILQQIVDVEIQIADLEADKKMYTNILKNAETLRKSLQTDFNNFTADEQAILLEINNRKDRLAQIEAQIAENKAEMEKIEENKKEIAMKRSFAEACRAACITWEKEHEFSFGNFTNALFKGFDMYTDYATGRCLVKAAGNATKVVGGQITKAALWMNEGNKIFNALQRQFCKEDGSPQMYC
jgi:septal ring factor EnvC (AmiA/AmiB activator)